MVSAPEEKTDEMVSISRLLQRFYRSDAATARLTSRFRRRRFL